MKTKAPKVLSTVTKPKSTLLTNEDRPTQLRIMQDIVDELEKLTKTQLEEAWLHIRKLPKER